MDHGAEYNQDALVCYDSELKAMHGHFKSSTQENKTLPLSKEGKPIKVFELSLDKM